MLGFSSTQITRAFSGGFRYSPTMSAALGTNCGSVLTHPERWRCRQRPSLRSTRQTACTDPPTARAGSRSWIRYRFPSQEAFCRVAQISRHLAHPKPLRLPRHSRDLPFPTGQIVSELLAQDPVLFLKIVD